ncbi:3-methyladenine DNA glycosylase [Thermococcus sp. P6]|uniref:DNA-3-methyladenine glycosylase family protein n=1 Tax=Thermococcus sp. P6 TaxID=122420 RepID=UPI000B59A633|nr:DNA-3-methyladenine glycosylase [Thermococcus sp. P6]ASJ11023.1 3-methyladenine DNA glycosylase [Thermococcus sp. P6]
MAGIDLSKTTREMIRNGTWKFEDGVFYMALESGVAGYDGENFLLSDSLSRRERKNAREKLEFVLGLDTDLDSFYGEIADSPFAFLAGEFRGLVASASPTPYQALVETIAQQQVSFEFAQRTIASLVRLAGRSFGDLHAFPSPGEVAGLSTAELKETKLGYRGFYIKSLTGLYLEGKLDLELWEWKVEDAIDYLTKFRGIGRWSAELFLAYGLRKNVYPASDLGLRRGISKILGRPLKEVTAREVRETLEPYGKWKGLLAFYISCYDRKTEAERRKR